MKVLTTILFIILTLLCLTRTTLSELPTLKKNIFILSFQCQTNDKMLCDKVNNVINIAEKYIAATLNLKSTIKINVTVSDLCKVPGNCDAKAKLLGAAAPVLAKNKDMDGKTRLYPQALYKQKHLQSGQNDIELRLNSNGNFWFREDPSPISIGQIDLLFVVIHELTHGLGFTNSWNDNLFKNKALIPGADPSRQPLFIENIFDKFIVLIPSGKSLSSITDELNQFQFNSTGSEQDFINAFSQSPQFSIAQDVYKMATTPGKMGFLLISDIQPNTPLTPDQIKNDIVLLDTSTNPFNNGANIGHVDSQTYLNTSDFLMVPFYPPGKTLEQMMINAGSTNTTGPIGPKLRRLLGVLGYDVKQDYIPPSINTGIHISINLLLSFICILLTFINCF